MTRVFSVEGVRMSIGLIFLLIGMGCATTSDLEEVNQGLTQKLEALDSTLRTQVADLRTDFKTAQATQEQSIAALTEETNKRLSSIEQAVVKVEHLPSLLAHLGAEMQALKRTLFATYELEEVALRERLKALAEFRRNLDQLPAESTYGPTPASVMTAPREVHTRD